MKPRIRSLSSRCLAVLAALLLALAQSGVRAQPAFVYSQQEIDQMLAPIALYPDTLLSQVLVAATFPVQVIEAARWSRERADLSGDAAVRAAETETWDPSVKSLLAFPQLLEYMRDNLQWMQALGNAFLGQQAQVMDSVQVLRRKAQAAGGLRSDDHLSVIENGSNLLLQPVDSRIVYVPYYDPLLAYGTWTWTAYPPVHLRPWPGYHVRPAHAGLFHWGPPVAISARWFVRAIDWPRREVRLTQKDNHYHRVAPPQPHLRPQPGTNPPESWRHGPDRRWRSTDAGTGTPQHFGPVSAPPPARTGANARGGRGERTEERHHPGPRFEKPGDARMRPELPAVAHPPRGDPGAHREMPRAAEAHLAPRPVPITTQHRPVSMPNRQEPPVRTQAPAAAAPTPAVRSHQAAGNREPSARFGVRP